MRTTVIPAQVTTVEDRIAGNLNLTQIVLLVASLFVNTLVYALVPEQMSFSVPKLILMAIIFAVFICLSLRIKGRVVISWLVILSAYAFRSHIYIFTKNTLFARDIEVPQPVEEKNIVKVKKPRKAEPSPAPDFDYASVIRNTGLNLRFRRKGILVVKNYD